MKDRQITFTFSLHRMLVLGVAVLALGVTTAAVWPAHPAEEGIREAIDHYFKGAELTSAEHFEQAFAVEAADMTFVRADRETGVESVRRVPIADAIQGWTRNPAGETWGKITDIQVLDDRLAHVTLDILWRGVIYTDVMAVYRVNDEWKIVNKTFVVKERLDG